jgi:alkanesulfonate monooxygenase SsuD/methylene tetrahydromethanopterin reductase-like flavin-dependent oxidoreductase (luciferase family)
MHFCLNLPNGGECADPRSLAELAVIAEDSGWDGVFLEDYLIYQNKVGIPTYDVWVTLAAMAMRTERVRLGTHVTPVARRRVPKLAAETIALDHLSGGRVTLGVGVGDAWDFSLTSFGEEPDTRRRAAMLDEGLDLLVRLWDGELPPRPVQQPRIPIWVGGRYPLRGPVQRAARWDGSCLYMAKSYAAESIEPADWTADDVRAFRTEVPPPPFDICVGGRKRSDDPEANRALIAELEAAGATWWSEWVPPADRATMQSAIARGPLR